QRDRRGPRRRRGGQAAGAEWLQGAPGRSRRQARPLDRRGIAALLGSVRVEPILTPRRKAAKDPFAALRLCVSSPVLVMFRRLLAYRAGLSFAKVLLFGLCLAVLIEALTAALRFGLHLESTRDTVAIGTYTLGLRVHHGYIGVFLMLLGWCFPRGIRHALWIVG